MGKRFRIVLLSLLALPKAWSAREAVVTAPRAIIWADQQRAVPLGYVRQGKLLRVGEKARHRRQVVPVVISGRIGYVALEDISFQTEPGAPGHYTRFQDDSLQRYGEHLVLGGTMWEGREEKQASKGRKGEVWPFKGVSLMGEARIAGGERTGLGVLMDYMTAERGDDAFRLFSVGLGVTWAFINTHRFKLKGEGWAMAVPWLQYESRPVYRVNGYGLGIMGRMTAVYYLADNWGLEAGLGLQAIKAYNIRASAPDKPFNTFLSGPRISLSAVYRF